MRTNELIDALVADTPARSMPLGRMLAIAAAIGFGMAALIFVASFGARSDIAAAMTTWRFLLKLLVAFVLFATAVRLVYLLAIPGRDARHAANALLVAPVLVMLAIGVELLTVPSTAWPSRALGMNSLICLTIVPALALPVLAACILALRHGAPTSPEVAGAAAGLCAGGAAAFLYATHCADDSPLFVAIWYTLAIALVAAAGAVAGKLWLRW